MPKLSIKANEKWFEQIPKIKYQEESQPPDVVSSLNAEAQNTWDSEKKLYHRLKENKNDKDFVWIKRILHCGTLSDKISAHTLLVQDSPVYNTSSIETLISMVNTKGKRECLMAMDALQDLFINVLLIEDKKLKQFSEQPLKEIHSLSKGSQALRKRILILWLFEDKLRSWYKMFINNLQVVSHDTVEKTKQKAVSVICNLLKENPEQEQRLLELIVNKIGDNSAKVGSHVCYLLLQLVIRHPDMKGVVIEEVHRFLFRKNLAERAKYYSLCFLNQIILNHDEYELANSLIMIYFAHFKHFVKKGEVNTKMMSALLTGVARAYPYSKLKDNVMMDQLDSMYRLVHVVSFNISVQALMLIFQVLDSKDSLSDRFYSVLYRKLFDPALSSSSRQALFLNMVYRALKKDVAAVRIKAFVKRLLQVSLYQQPNLQCGILMLISEITKIHPSILETKRYLESDSDSEEHYEDLPDEDDNNSAHEMDETSLNKAIKKLPSSSWVHKDQRKKKKKAYDFDSRNPLYAGAEFTSLWELISLRKSFHPSVSLFATQVCNSKDIKYSGDPLLDFTTTRFLDRFVYRNPKKQLENTNVNVHTKVFGGRKLKATLSQRVPVNSSDYVQQSAEKIPAEEQFIYQYLRKRAVPDKHTKDDSDLESVRSEDFQKMLDEVCLEGEGKDELNFAKELGLQKKKAGSKRKAESDSEDDSVISPENESDFEDDIEDIDFEDEELKSAFGNIDEDLNDTNMDLCEEDFVGEGFKAEHEQSKKRKASSLDEKLLQSAEEFSALLENNSGSKVDTISSHALKNKDKSGAKQLAWEMQRHRYIQGNKWGNKSKRFKKNKKGRN